MIGFTHAGYAIHDEYRPTGWSRTYPNLLTQVGVRGNEEMPPAAHNAILPFTRFLCGPADYTICWYNERIKTTHAHQLAASAVYFSPLQFLFWYDKPAQCGWEPALEFFKQLPTTWDETRLVNGEIGRFITTARRKRDDWFVGTMNGDQPRALEIPLSFLTPGKEYTAHIYADDDSSPTRTKVGITTRPVNSQTKLEVPLRAAGGRAVWVTPPTRAGQ